jgi:hypothetical protein
MGAAYASAIASGCELFVWLRLAFFGRYFAASLIVSVGSLDSHLFPRFDIFKVGAKLCVVHERNRSPVDEFVAARKGKLAVIWARSSNHRGKTTGIHLSLPNDRRGCSRHAERSVLVMVGTSDMTVARLDEEVLYGSKIGREPIRIFRYTVDRLAVVFTFSLGGCRR